ncbi:MAG: hypothetical protein DU429_04905 [Candidatus Tokpelaia sp.]|nr:MAG: hypothetical protein DU430_00895 [Candidatus Tokpelaia sp.]KAA6206963.1 MAG: hypothetical protein DU429_04905 [Candidatus Tokpelaia sp.]
MKSPDNRQRIGAAISLSKIAGRPVFFVLPREFAQIVHCFFIKLYNALKFIYIFMPISPSPIGFLVFNRL